MKQISADPNSFSSGTTLVVLGMARSGTSFLSHVLRSCGVFMGGSEIPPQACNLNGFGEAFEVVAINDKILATAGGSWHNIPPEIKHSDDSVGEIKRFLSALECHQSRGFKDPRLVLTFPLWKPFIGSYRIIVCFRHPMAVAKSLAAMLKMPENMALTLWSSYNRRLLEHLRDEVGVLWFNYDCNSTDIQAWLRYASQELDVNLTTESPTLFNRFLRHHEATKLPTEHPTTAIYEDLLSRWKNALLRKESSLSKAPIDSSNPTTDASVGAARRDVSALSAILERHGAILQDFDLTFRPLSSHVDRLYEITNAVIARLNNLDLTFRPLINQVDGLHDSTSMLQKATASALTDLVEQIARLDKVTESIVQRLNEIDQATLTKSESLPLARIRRGLARIAGLFRTKRT